MKCPREATSKRALQSELERWRQALESRGMKIRRSITEYMTADGEGDQQDTMQLDGVNVKRMKSSLYLGAMTDPPGGMEKELNHRIQCGWNRWRKVAACYDPQSWQQHSYRKSSEISMQTARV
ncbi:uncharacterized protein LOC119578621 [Penaeus monodon]|uniref:uncharacterized protein LOC119578621 n=1 Tax=Penaeus monodon TaxID=6687 RepID=UPI0018A7B57E|nr:uncharacterized protein LOC119578621 [Penaeus monodon]